MKINKNKLKSENENYKKWWKRKIQKKKWKMKIQKNVKNENSKKCEKWKSKKNEKWKFKKNVKNENENENNLWEMKIVKKWKLKNVDSIIEKEIIEKMQLLNQSKFWNLKCGNSKIVKYKYSAWRV